MTLETAFVASPLPRAGWDGPPRPRPVRVLAVHDLVDDLLGVVDRDGEADPDAARRAVGRGRRAVERRVDADDVALGVDQRAAGVALVDRRVRLDRGVARRVLGPVRRAAERRLLLLLALADVGQVP